MVDVRWLPIVATSLVTLGIVSCSSPRIVGSQYVYRYPANGDTCIYASFDMSFNVYYDVENPGNEPQYQTLWLPNNTMVNITGECGDNYRDLRLSWDNNSIEMAFGINKGKWKMVNMTLVFNITAQKFNLSQHMGLQTFYTNGSDLFSRTFKTDEYFYCENCKTYEFLRYNQTVCGADCQTPCVLFNDKTNFCSSVHMEKSVIFIGDPGKADKRLCLEDYIQLQEIIVPIAVGGVLALLLILIFVAYIIAYVRRRRREAKSQYEPVGDF